MNSLASSSAFSRVHLRFLVLVVLAAGCSRQGSNSSSPEGASAAPPVVTMVNPQQRTLRRTIEQPGKIEAYEQTPLHVKIAGYVEKVNVDIGSRVDKGDILAELRVPEMHEELKQKAALVEQAEAEVELAKKAAQVARDQVETAKGMVVEADAGRDRAQASLEYRQAEYKRTTELTGSKVLDKRFEDEARLQLGIAQAGRKEADAKYQTAQAYQKEIESKRDKAQAEVRVAEGRREVAQADQRRTAALLEYAKITAPYDGVVTRRSIHTGHFLQPATSGKGEPLFTVERIDRLRIFVEVPEADANWVKEGAPARVRVQPLAGREFEGEVARSAWSLDPQTRTLRTEIQLTKPDDGKLLPGMYAYAGITVEHAKVLALPASAVVTQGEQTFCYRVEDGKAVRTPIRVGARDGQWVEVLKKQTKPAEPGKEGLWEDFSGSEEIVERDAKTLTDGQTVTVAPRKS